MGDHRETAVGEDPKTTSETERLAPLLATAPVFLQPWWLEAVAPGAWDYAVVWRGQAPAALMPYVRRRGAFGQRWLVMPPFTQFLGPWLRPSKAKYVNQLAEQKDLMTELIEALPPHAYFSQSFHHGLTNWLPFCWKGFQQTTRYTYVLDNLDDLDAVWKGLESTTRNTIRKAEKQVRVVHDLGIDEILAVRRMTFERQGLHSGDDDIIRRLDEACRRSQRPPHVLRGRRPREGSGYLLLGPGRPVGLLSLGGR